MIDWSEAAARLARLARDARPGRLLSVTLPLARWPGVGLPQDGDWCFWQRPDRALRLVGIGRALAATSAGVGRVQGGEAAHGGLVDGWRHAGEGDAAPLGFTGFAFAPRGGAPLPNASLWVPELLLRECGAGRWVTFSCAANQVGEAPARWRALWRGLQTKAAPGVATRFTPLRNPLAEQAFLARGRAALRTIAAGDVDKLVLTRTLRLQADGPVATDAVLAALAARHPACATFGIGRKGRAFVGASPETLLALDGATVAVDAIAGTAWEAADAPLGTDKNRREHEFVARDVADALAPLCHDIAVPAAAEVLRVDALSHLRRRVTARRAPDVSVFDLIARLHPTPAVGGTPTAAALDWLARHGDRRGAWYTGGIGWVDAAGDCDIAVALRCGLLDGRAATLYAGAGFVAGSDPELERAETDAKFSAMHTALAACARRVEERDAA